MSDQTETETETETETSARIPVASPDLGGNEAAYLAECIRDGQISSRGRFVGRFEAGVAAACGVAHGVAVSSGSNALHVALRALGIGPSDEVIVPSLTMIACGNAVVQTGARLVVCDVDRATWNVCPRSLAEAIGPRTRAALLVDLYGRPLDPAPLAVCAARGVPIVEDAAEAFGARASDGRAAGAIGRLAIFSFYANKIITTGEGGMVLTDDDELAERARRLCDMWFVPERRFFHPEVGYSYRMSNLQAAVGCAQLERAEALIARRQDNAVRWRAALDGIPGIALPAPPAPGSRHVHWMFGILVEERAGMDRDRLAACLAADGIETRPFFLGLHAQPCYPDARRLPCEVAEDLGARGLLLPSGPALSDDDIARVAAVIRRAGR
ncbi:MAG: DegT/DnrJ/EryC1/StrS family aminotransferase [Myxococcales bacterium]|nr:DegT/DnrJ/EryC1/StrS family aminotransferase [Myxococcales bacterium]